jgi:C-terminal processing protease CtpA/Prc
MAFQTADKVVTVGNQTGSRWRCHFWIYRGYRTAISGNGVLYPNGTETQRKGITIDIEIKPTIKLTKVVTKF